MVSGRAEVFVEGREDVGGDDLAPHPPRCWAPAHSAALTPGGRRGLRLLIPTSIEALQRKPALLSLLLGQLRLGERFDFQRLKERVVAIGE